MAQYRHLHRSHTTPSPSPSRALGTLAAGNPRPDPLPPWTRGLPAATASSQEAYVDAGAGEGDSAPPVSVGVGPVVSVGPAWTMVRPREGAHVPSISRSASASGSAAVSCHVFLMAIQSMAYWHQ